MFNKYLQNEYVLNKKQSESFLVLGHTFRIILPKLHHVFVTKKNY